MGSPPLIQKMKIPYFASDIPNPCDTGDTLFKVAGRVEISLAKHTPTPNHTQFSTVVCIWDKQLNQYGNFTGSIHIKTLILTVLIGRESNDY